MKRIITRRLVASVASGSVLLGSAAVAGVVGPTVAAAEEAPAAAEEAGTDEAATDEDAGPRHGEHGRPSPGDVIAATLAGLVEQGVLSEEQARITGEAIRESFEKVGDHADKHHKQLLMRFVRGSMGVAVETIGLTPEEMREQLVELGSVAAVAEANGVAPSTVTAAIVSAGDDAIVAALEAGEITAEQAEWLRERLPEAASRFVNHEFEGRPGPGNGRPGDRPVGPPAGVPGNGPGQDA